ncbi:MAG TPA: hypothetical protein VKP66_19980, partial [Steroidobacteraceae bacterium]|nr:hypothetical protein [Steroidobacteraceae bacterium]
MRPAFLFLVLSIPAWAWQERQSNPQLALIRQVRQRMAENLTALPNYTCLETTDRSVRNQVKQKLLFRDKIHLEVAFIEASEMFCWPGSAHFESDLLQQLPQAGASGIGGFGGWTRALFGPSAPNFTYAGECQFEGRHGARYTFRVPLRSSTYVVKFGGGEAVSPYTGSLCLDPEALDIIQLEIRTTLTPPPVAAISEVIQYGRSRIGAVDFLLPQVDQLTVTDLEGSENRNVTRFTACHEYTSESSVNFDPERTAAPGPQTPAEELQIPGGVSMALRLDTPITFEESAVGDAITARLNRAVKASG